jgi:hypothetical protein
MTAHAQANLTVLCFHDVVDTVSPKDANDTVSLDALIKEIEWLKRTGSQSQVFAKELADVFQQELPNRPVASNVKFARRTLVFQELNACRLPADENLRKLAQTHTWLELHADGCDLSDAFSRLRGVESRHWGAYAANFSVAVPRVLQPTAASQ